MVSRFFPVALVALALCCGASTADDQAPTPKAVDLVFVLDTSASMEGLIDAARDKLSRVITSIATARPEPDLRLALLTYGSGDEGSQQVLSGGVILQSDLTFDFDAVFERLDEVPTAGGREHVGSALFHTLTQLNWSRGALRIVFVAGNESADQDPLKRMAVVAERLGQRARVNAIYCGGEDDGVSDTWKLLAEKGKGRFASIDHNQGTVTVASPFDKELASLSKRLSRTYLFAGAPVSATDRLARTDARVETLGLALAAERAIYKATALFRLPGDRLHELLSTTSASDGEEARRLEQQIDERRETRARIRALAARRQAHVDTSMKRQGLDDRLAFDRAVRETLSEQLGAAGFRLD